MLNSCFRSGSLALSQCRGIITLSFKKGDRLDPRNWHPITLLNVDYKISSGVIAGRLLKVTHLVVSSNQTCGVPGRFIRENVSFLRDVVHYASSSGTPVVILSLDQEKAFDRVDWGFMRSTLVAMGFGPSSISWVNLFYFHVQSLVNVNGYLSPFFTLSQGVRLGCPLSLLLYVLVSEVLTVNIHCNPRVSGLSLPGFPPLSPISQYTDHTSLVLTSDESIRAVFEMFAQFEATSGAKLNRSKSSSRSAAGARNRSLLVDLVAHLKSKVDVGSVSSVSPYRSVLESLASLDREVAKGAQVCSRIRWVEEGVLVSVLSPVREEACRGSMDSCVERERRLYSLLPGGPVSHLKHFLL